MKSGVNGLMIGLVLFGLGGVRPAGASVYFPEGLSYDQLRGDVRHIMHELDVDFWKGVDEVGGEIDPDYEQGKSRKNLSGIMLGGAGVAMLSTGIINERAVASYPKLPREQAVARYRRWIGRGFKKSLAKVAPRKSAFYQNWSKAITDFSTPEDAAIAAGKFVPRWVGRTFLIGGGIVITASALAYLLSVDFDYTNMHQLFSGKPEQPSNGSQPSHRSNLMNLKPIFDQPRTEDEIVDIVVQSPEIATQVHQLSKAIGELK